MHGYCFVYQYYIADNLPQTSVGEQNFILRLLSGTRVPHRDQSTKIWEILKAHLILAQEI